MSYDYRQFYKTPVKTGKIKSLLKNNLMQVFPKGNLNVKKV